MATEPSGSDERRIAEVSTAALQSVRNVVLGQDANSVVQAHNVGSVHIISSERRSVERKIPRQLPLPPTPFVNRSYEFEVLSRLRAGGSAELRPLVAVLTGMSGVGKSATAIRWAHSCIDQFPGGQYYFDLADARGGIVEAGDILRSFLLASGVYDSDIPRDLPNRAAMFRVGTQDAPVLVVLDNVGQSAQVRPLLPGSAGSMVLVTSRQRLSGLLVDGAGLVEVYPLDSGDSSSLVAQMLRDARILDRRALQDLAELCGGLPITLRIAGARLAARPEWSISRLVGYLADETRRLGRLSIADEYRVDATFDLAYNDLPVSVQRIYCYLGLWSGPDLSVQVIAAATKIPFEVVSESLDVLREANLITISDVDRYQFHELIRLHARQCAERDQSSYACEIVLRGIISWYLLGASAADHAVLGQSRWRLAEIDISKWSTTFDLESAMAWFEAERANLLIAVHTADRQQWYSMVWQLCEALWAFYYGRKYYSDWIEAHRLGVKAAVQTGNRVAEARMRNHLARAYIEISALDHAIEQLVVAWKIAVDSGDRRAEAAVLESYGILARKQEQNRQAIDLFQWARAINEEIGDRRGEALQLYQIGDVLVAADRPNDAVSALIDSFTLLDDLGDEMAKARVCIVLGRAHLALNRRQDARAVLQFAVAVARKWQQPLKEAQALEELVRVVEQEKEARAPYRRPTQGLSRGHEDPLRLVEESEDQ